MLTFDGYGKEIIEKSYPNLDPTAFSFVWLGPLIKAIKPNNNFINLFLFLKVNNDMPVFIDRGT